MNPFKPTADTVNIDVAASSASVLVSNDISIWRKIRVFNNGSATAWIRFGSTAPTATLTADIPIGSGMAEVYTVHATPVYVAAIAAGSTGKIYFTPGEGM